MAKNEKVAAARRSPQGGTISSERIRDQKTGRFVTIRTLKIEPDTFGSSFSSIFQKNVDKARRENKDIVGVRDVVPAK